MKTTGEGGFAPSNVHSQFSKFSMVHLFNNNRRVPFWTLWIPLWISVACWWVRGDSPDSVCLGSSAFLVSFYKVDQRWQQDPGGSGWDKRHSMHSSCVKVHADWWIKHDETLCWKPWSSTSCVRWVLQEKVPGCRRQRLPFTHQSQSKRT